MVNIDTVYQKVLSLANKEQRGYITPQEFNLMADKVQLEIFDSYFHDVKTTDMKPKTNLFHADELYIIEDKISLFRTSSNTILEVGMNNILSLPSDFYRLKYLSIPSTLYPSLQYVEAHEVNEKDLATTDIHPLMKPTNTRPVFYRRSNGLHIKPGFTEDVGVTLVYYKKPSTPAWAYVVVNGKALYNNNLSVNFELHPSEEEVIVAKILALAGVVIMKPEIVQYGSGMDMAIKQSQND